MLIVYITVYSRIVVVAEVVVVVIAVEIVVVVLVVITSLTRDRWMTLLTVIRYHRLQ